MKKLTALSGIVLLSFFSINAQAEIQPVDNAALSEVDGQLGLIDSTLFMIGATATAYVAHEAVEKAVRLKIAHEAVEAAVRLKVAHEIAQAAVLVTVANAVSNHGGAHSH